MEKEKESMKKDEENDNIMKTIKDDFNMEAFNSTSQDELNVISTEESHMEKSAVNPSGTKDNLEGERIIEPEPQLDECQKEEFESSKETMLSLGNVSSENHELKHRKNDIEMCLPILKNISDSEKIDGDVTGNDCTEISLDVQVVKMPCDLFTVDKPDNHLSHGIFQEEIKVSKVCSQDSPDVVCLLAEENTPEMPDFSGTDSNSQDINLKSHFTGDLMPLIFPSLAESPTQMIETGQLQNDVEDLLAHRNESECLMDIVKLPTVNVSEHLPVGDIVSSCLHVAEAGKCTQKLLSEIHPIIDIYPSDKMDKSNETEKLTEFMREKSINILVDSETQDVTKSSHLDKDSNSQDKDFASNIDLIDESFHVSQGNTEDNLTEKRKYFLTIETLKTKEPIDVVLANVNSNVPLPDSEALLDTNSSSDNLSSSAKNGCSLLNVELPATVDCDALSLANTQADSHSEPLKDNFQLNIILDTDHQLIIEEKPSDAESFLPNIKMDQEIMDSSKEGCESSMASGNVDILQGADEVEETIRAECENKQVMFLEPVHESEVNVNITDSVTEGDVAKVGSPHLKMDEPVLLMENPEIHKNQSMTENLFPEIKYSESSMNNAVVVAEYISEMENPVPDMENPVPEMENPVPEMENPVPEMENLVPELDFPVPEMVSLMDNTHKKIENSTPLLQNPVSSMKNPVLDMENPLPEIEQSKAEIQNPISEMTVVESISGEKPWVNPGLVAKSMSPGLVETEHLTIHESVSESLSHISETETHSDEIAAERPSMHFLMPPSTVDTESSNSSFVSVSTSTTQPLQSTHAISNKDEVFLLEDGTRTSSHVTGHASVDEWCAHQASMSEQETELTDSRTSIKFNTDNIPVVFEDPEFDWEEYLEETNTTAAPHTAFPHVEASLRSNFEKGMKFEVPHGDPVRYWIATVVMPCGQLLRLRYDGNQLEGSKDFWCDAFTSDIHPLGWCKQNGKLLEPPDEVKENLQDWQDYVIQTLEQATTASDKLLGGVLGTAAVDQIKQGMLVEVQHEQDLSRVWIARILENIGGRLLLRYEGTDWAGQDFWLFYLHPRIHPLGWAADMELEYGPPEVIAEEWSRDEGWKAVLEKTQAEAQNLLFPADVLNDQEMVQGHTMEVGWRLEALHPVHMNNICPATITRVLSDTYFLVTIDDLDPEMSMLPVNICCHGGSRNIFPINWCEKNGIKLEKPNGWQQKDFNWLNYLAHVQAEAAPTDAFTLDVESVEFEKGMRLEAANPDHPGQICVATVSQVIPPLVFIHVESSALPKSFHIIDIQSQEIFPVGWCESNNYPLKPPHRLFFTRRQPTQDIPKETLSTSSQSKPENGERGSSWCPKIYFNHRCFSGLYLSKGRIAELPKYVGPGPVTLVMKEILSMLINVAYKSSRVLRELQLDGAPNPNLHQQVLKAKYKGKSYRAVVEVCKSSDQVDEFCRAVCMKLECCPYLFSTTFINGICPENCSQQSKTKYTSYVGKKKKKVGRPPGGHTNLEGGARKPGKRRKRKRIGLIKGKKSASTPGITDNVEDDEADNDNDPDFMVQDDTSNSTILSMECGPLDENSKRRKRKYTRHVAPPLEMKTRGVKLPRFSIEKRTRTPRLSLDIALGIHPGNREQDFSGSFALPSHRKSAFLVQPVRREDDVKLHSNPLYWSVAEVVKYIHTTDCAPLARIFKEEEIDGQALLLLNLPTVQELMEVKLGPAIKLCSLVEKLKIAFYHQYASGRL